MSYFQKSVNGFLNNKISSAVSKLDPNVQSIFWTLMGQFGGEGNYSNKDIDAIAKRAEALFKATGATGQIQVKQENGGSAGATGQAIENFDWRARLRPKNGGRDAVYGTASDPNSLLAPLKNTGGMVWQVTPQIYMSGVANYASQHLHGANYPIYTYINSTPPTIPVQSDFYANDMFDAHYLLAVMHFLKVSTKSYFGETSVNNGTYGTPPPTLLFEYLGEHGFNKVPVLINDYSIQLPEDCDYVPVVTNVGGTGGSETTYVPTRMNIMVNLVPSYAPKKTREKFDLESLRSGKGYKDGFV